MAKDQQLSRRNFLWVAASAAMVGACTSDGSNSTDTSGAGTTGEPSEPRILRFHDRGQAPPSLDPAKGQGWSPLTYDVLIYKAPDGSYQPQLATSWQYIGDGNTTFEINLRPDITFSDGEPMNAEAVKANIDYRLDPSVGSQSAAHLATITEVEIVDDLTVRLHLSEPNPLMPEVFSQEQGGPGALISPVALADPDVLSTGTFGVGRYKLDTAGTVHGDHYSYSPDPNYWNPDAVLWDKVVAFYMPEESAALAALQTGEIDAARATFAIVDAGRDAGFGAVGPGFPIVLGVSLFDRGGEVSPALGDTRVRQALNYAVDREKISTALVGDSGMPTDQLSAPGHSGWNDEPFYPYNPTRAEQLLAEAGYADGFSFSVRVPQAETHTRLTQAVADDLKQIGVQVDIVAVPGEEFDQADDATNRDFGAVYLGWGISQPFRMATSFWLPDATNNAFDTADETLVDLHQQLATADEDARADLDRQIVARVAELAWFLPVVIHGESVLFNADVIEVPWTDFVSQPMATEFRPVGG